MDFSGINYIAVIVAGIAAMPLGAAYYGLLAKPWMSAAGVTEEDVSRGGGTSYIVAIVCNLVIAYFLAGVVGHLGATTLGGGIITAFFCWLGFTIPPMAVAHRFQIRPWSLTIIDGAYWLIVMLVQGAIIGWWGT